MEMKILNTGKAKIEKEVRLEQQKKENVGMFWIKDLACSTLRLDEILDVAKKGHLIRVKIDDEVFKHVPINMLKNAPDNTMFYILSVKERSPLICDVYCEYKSLFTSNNKP